MNLIHDLVVVILKACPPVKREEVLGIQEIEQWFDSDSEALVICIQSLTKHAPVRTDPRSRFQSTRTTGQTPASGWFGRLGTTPDQTTFAHLSTPVCP